MIMQGLLILAGYSQALNVKPSNVLNSMSRRFGAILKYFALVVIAYCFRQNCASLILFCCWRVYDCVYPPSLIPGSATSTLGWQAEERATAAWPRSGIGWFRCFRSIAQSVVAIASEVVTCAEGTAPRAVCLALRQGMRRRRSVWNCSEIPTTSTQYSYIIQNG